MVIFLQGAKFKLYKPGYWLVIIVNRDHYVWVYFLVSFSSSSYSPDLYHLSLGSKCNFNNNYYCISSIAIMLHHLNEHWHSKIGTLRILKNMNTVPISAEEIHKNERRAICNALWCISSSVSCRDSKKNCSKYKRGRRNVGGVTSEVLCVTDQ
jgi:hypothetical protein